MLLRAHRHGPDALVPQFTPSAYRTRYAFFSSLPLLGHLEASPDVKVTQARIAVFYCATCVSCSNTRSHHRKYSTTSRVLLTQRDSWRDEWGQHEEDRESLYTEEQRVTSELGPLSLHGKASKQIDKQTSELI